MKRVNVQHWPVKKAKTQDWREEVFKRRGQLLLPIAAILLLFGRPTLLTAEMGILIALAGEALRIWAVGYSGETTRADHVTAPQLVTAGPYAYSRNPLYLGNALIAIGFAVAFAGGLPSSQQFWIMVIVIGLLTAVYASIIPLEEQYLAHTFGTKYMEYTTLVPRLLPWRGALAADRQHGTWRPEVIWRAEITTLLLFAAMVVAVLLKLGPLSRLTIVL